MLKRVRSFRLVTLIGFVTVVAIGLAAYQRLIQPEVRGYETADAAAVAMFRSHSSRNYKLFVRARLLGVCEGYNDWPPRYAESLHLMKFATEQGDVGYYELPKSLKTETVRVVGRQPFGPKHQPFLVSAMISSYYAETFVCVEVGAENADGLEHRARIVVGKTSGKWYAVPRRRNSGFYKIADEMTLDKPKS